MYVRYHSRFFVPVVHMRLSDTTYKHFFTIQTIVRPTKMSNRANKTIFLENKVQCNLDLVTLLVSTKTVTKLHNVTKSNDFM